MEKIICCTSYGRAGLLGNPSDGFGGKTISVALDCFPATVIISESRRTYLRPNEEDRDDYDNLDSMVHEIDRFGYYGGLRLLKATCRRFWMWCRDHQVSLAKRNFSMSYQSTIPQLVGLGGSSAICTATLKALQKFYEVTIPLEEQPTLCWQAECDLNIACGLQDRVIQIYGGLVYMDFSPEYFNQHGWGRYESLDPKLLPPFYVAYDPERAEFSGLYHGKLRREMDGNRHREVMAAMSEFAEIARRGREALLKGDVQQLDQLINANFDLRRKVLEVSPQNARMVEVARSAGVSAKFAGSGGAIIGLCFDEQQERLLREKLAAIGCTVVRPGVALEER